MRLKFKGRVDYFKKYIEVKITRINFIAFDSSRVPHASCLPLSFVFHWVTLNTSVPLFFFLQIFVKS